MFAIIIIAVLGLALLAGAAFLAYKLLAKKGVEVAAMASENPEIIKPYDGEKFEKVEATSPRVKKKKRSIKNKSVITVGVQNN